MHTLAKAYHWSERDILSMPCSRRFAYLLMVEAEYDAQLLRGLKGA